MEQFLHKMQVQQFLIPTKFGIDAPMIDLSTINDNTSDEDGDDNASISKMLQVDKNKMTNVT